MCRRGSGRREPLMMNGTERLIGLRMRKVTLRKRHWKKPARIAGGCVWFVLAVLLCRIFLGGTDGCYTNSITHVDSYRQIYQYYMGLLEKQDKIVLKDSDAMNAKMGGENTSGGDVQYATASVDSNVQTYVSINQRETGVGEADAIITDGQYIYELVQKETENDWGDPPCIHILKPEGKQTKEILKFKLSVPKNENGSTGLSSDAKWLSYRTAALYVYQDILVVAEELHGLAGEEELQGTVKWDVKTAVYFYDISDIRHPKELRHILQNGSYNTLREYQGVLYLVTQNWDVPVTAMKEKNKERYVPWLDGKFLETDNIILPEDAQGNAYTMVSTWKLQKDVKKINAKVVIGLYTGVYMTENNLYLSTTLYADIAQQEKNDSSRILRFKLDGGKLVENKTVVMPGSFANSFAIQERKDMLYVVTEIIHYAYEQDAKGEEGYESGQNYVSNTEICAYVFDDALEMISKCGNIAENEDVKAVRLLEDVGYVVSYQQTDPLISIDFSDPKELKVMDELKMPGFSTYLHPVKDNLLLGIGTTDDTQNQHIKIALYDISDNENLHIFDEKLIEDMENSNVEYDYKGVFIDGDNSIVGFGGMTYDEKYLDDPEEKAYRNTYVLYRYSREGKLEPIGDYEVKTGSSGTVGMRIGSWFYIIPYGHADVSDMVIVPYL